MKAFALHDLSYALWYQKPFQNQASKQLFSYLTSKGDEGAIYTIQGGFPMVKIMINLYKIIFKCQHFLTNIPLNPSGPGALSNFMCFTIHQFHHQ
jgi:hypothetical protein